MQSLFTNDRGIYSDGGRKGELYYIVLVGDMIPPNISEQRLHYMLDVFILYYPNGAAPASSLNREYYAYSLIFIS